MHACARMHALGLSKCPCVMATSRSYAGLALASFRRTPGSWGDLTTLSGFWRHVSRAECVAPPSRARIPAAARLGGVSVEGRHRPLAAHAPLPQVWQLAPRGT